MSLHVESAFWKGVPLVLVPWDRDQPGVARRAQRLGIAVVIQRDDLSNEALGHAVEHVLQDSYYSDRARKRAACEPETLASSRARLVEQL